MDVVKFCSKCEQVKDSQDFCRDSSKKSGLSSWCKICVKAWSRAYRKSHKTEVALAQVKWAVNNKERVKEKLKRYVLDNRPAIRVHKERYRKNNPGKMAAKDKRRQEQERISTPVWADKAKMAVFYKLAKVLSGDDAQYHVDHIVPLKSEFVCGLHVEYNLEVVSASYNVAKGNNYWPHGYGEHGIENLQYNRMS